MTTTIEASGETACRRQTHLRCSLPMTTVYALGTCSLPIRRLLVQALRISRIFEAIAHGRM